MKTLLVAMSFVIPLTSFGACYVSTTEVPNFVPAKFCLERIQQSGLKNVLEVRSLDDSFPGVLEVKSTDSLGGFKAEKVLVDVWAGACAERSLAILKVEGESYVNIDPSKLVLSVSTAFTNDSCHIVVEKRTIQYELRNF
jgi:hypothetical protein